MPNLPPVVLWSIPAFALLTVVELVSFRLRPDEDQQGYRAKDTAIARDLTTADNWRDRVRHLTRGPGWQPGPPTSPEGTTAC